MADTMDDFARYASGLLSTLFGASYREQLEAMARCALSPAHPLSQCPDYMERIAEALEALDQREVERG